MRIRLGVACLALPVLVGGCSDDDDKRSKSPATSTIDCSESDITESEFGTNVHLVTIASRFSICLDESEHPLSGLIIDACLFGNVSSLSINGPERYPIGFEVTESGSCVVRNGDFQVTVVASD